MLNWQDSCEPYFMAIFCFDAVLKILAHGLVLHKGAYLRHPMNVIDGVVVVTGLVCKYIYIYIYALHSGLFD